MWDWFIRLDPVYQALIGTLFTWLVTAAGAMIFVAVEELIPESQHNGNVDLATMACIGGFSVMMTLDVALG